MHRGTLSSFSCNMYLLSYFFPFYLPLTESSCLYPMVSSLLAPPPQLSSEPEDLFQSSLYWMSLVPLHPSFSHSFFLGFLHHCFDYDALQLQLLPVFSMGTSSSVPDCGQGSFCCPLLSSLTLLLSTATSNSRQLSNLWTLSSHWCTKSLFLTFFRTSALVHLAFT